MEIKKERWIPCKSRCSNTNWNKDIFYEVCSILLHDCAVLELVCLQFCDYMSSNDLWIRLFNIYYPESNGLPETEDIRTEFYSPIYHWDVDLYKKAKQNVENPRWSHVDLKFQDDRRTIEEITNKTARWKLAKCLEPLPRTEGRFFCFAMDVIRCDTSVAYVICILHILLGESIVLLYSFFTYTSSYVGFGISPQLPNDMFLIGSTPHDCPWIWHTVKNPGFKKGDQVGLVGCVKDGYYLCNFFINDQFHPWFHYTSRGCDFNSFYLSIEKEVFIHFTIVTGEKFTITRPKLGNYYYYNKFKDSDAYKQGISYCGKVLHDCAVLELVCLQFCDYMSSNDLWIRLFNIYYPESNGLPETEDIRTEFYSPLYHWDVDLYEKVKQNADSNYSPWTYYDLKFHDDRRTIEEITNKTARWKLAKCLEPLPRTEGRFFCFAMDVIRCDTKIANVGFGISHQLPNHFYLNGSPPTNACPWICHSLKGAVFKKGDQVGLVGCVKDGYYLFNFFINDQFHPWYHYNNSGSTLLKGPYLSTQKEVFIHFAIVTGEKFTITRPTLGSYYYYNKFKDSDAYKQGISYCGSM